MSWHNDIKPKGNRVTVSVRLPPHVIEYFKSNCPVGYTGYTSYMADVLAAYASTKEIEEKK